MNTCAHACGLIDDARTKCMALALPKRASTVLQVNSNLKLPSPTPNTQHLGPAHQAIVIVHIAYKRDAVARVTQVVSYTSYKCSVLAACIS